MKVRTARLEALIWVLIYGGLLGGSLGFALERSGEAYGRGVVVCSALAVAGGIVLVWIRSRLP